MCAAPSNIRLTEADRGNIAANIGSISMQISVQLGVRLPELIKNGFNVKHDEKTGAYEIILPNNVRDGTEKLSFLTDPDNIQQRGNSFFIADDKITGIDVLPLSTHSAREASSQTSRSDDRPRAEAPPPARAATQASSEEMAEAAQLAKTLNGALSNSGVTAEVTLNQQGYSIALKDRGGKAVNIGHRQIQQLLGSEYSGMVQRAEDGTAFISKQAMEARHSNHAVEQSAATRHQEAAAAQSAPASAQPAPQAEPTPPATPPSQEITATPPVSPSTASPEALAAVQSTLEKQMPGGLGVNVSAAEGGGYAISLTRSDGTPFPANQNTLGTIARYLNVRPDQLAVSAETGTLTLTEAGFNASSTLRQASMEAENAAEAATEAIARKAARSVSHVGGAVTAAVAAGVTGISSLVLGHSPAEAAEVAVDASPAASFHAALQGRPTEAKLRAIEEIPGGIAVTEALRGALQYFGADVDPSLTQLALRNGIQQFSGAGEEAISALSANQWEERMSALRETLQANGAANTEAVIEKMNALYAQNPQAAMLIAQAAYNTPEQADRLLTAYNEAIQQGVMTQTAQMASQEAASGEKAASATPQQEGAAQQRT